MNIKDKLLDLGVIIQKKYLREFLIVGVILLAIFSFTFGSHYTCHKAGGRMYGYICVNMSSVGLCLISNNTIQVSPERCRSLSDSRCRNMVSRAPTRIKRSGKIP